MPGPVFQVNLLGPSAFSLPVRVRFSAILRTLLSRFQIAFALGARQSRAAPGRHQNCCTAFTLFARLTHPGLITFWTLTPLVVTQPCRTTPEKSLHTAELTTVHAVSERGNQGLLQRKGATLGTAQAVLVACLMLRPHAVNYHRRRRIVFENFYYIKNQWKRVSHFFLFTEDKFTESTASLDCLHAHCIPSPSLIIDAIVVTLTIQVHIIPGLEPRILTLPRLVSVVTLP